MRLSGKTALITGAARGIGLEFARAYLREGARVAICDIDLPAARKAADMLGEGAIAVALDVTRQDSIDACVAEVAAAFGGIDILINNAALFTAAPVVEITRADYDRIMAVNVSGTLFMMQAVARVMIARGQGG
ncbi:MAG: SDR family NAD(P)-dependent oxidoreductase, partial [Gemmobacter sp.]